MRIQPAAGILWLSLVLAPGAFAQDEDVCSFNMENTCAQCGWGEDITGPATPDKEYNCSLPGLTDFAPGGQYEGVQANYLSFVTEGSCPNFPVRAAEFEACTGGRIVFSEANDIFADPVEDLGTATSQGTEVYDGYFMSYSHFPEVSALGLIEPLNDRIRQDNSRLKWEDVLPKVKQMGEYRHRNGETNIEFLMYDGDFFVPVIRVDLLEKHDLPLPNSWEELVEYANFFNGTDLNDDGETDNDFGFCHFPATGAGSWDMWFSEAVYSTWATMDQTKGTSEGIFFDEDTLEPRVGKSESLSRAAEIWKELWKVGATAESDIFLEGRCALGFAPPGSWKRLFLTPNGVHRSDSNGTVIWQPTMKTGEYAEPYRFKPFGSTTVHDRTTGEMVPCTPKLCPKAELVPARGHHGDDDRLSILPPSPLAGQLMNRAPFYWSGGLGTVIRKSAPKRRKDLLWDFFVYSNSPDTSVYDVANYRSWLDSWRFSQLAPGDNFIQAGWSQTSYEEHAATMKWALSKEANGVFNLRLPGLATYTFHIFGVLMGKYIEDEISLTELIDQTHKGWEETTDEYGRLGQLEIYRSSLGLMVHTEVELCRIHRELMDEKDPSVCRQYDDNDDATLLMAVLIPVGVLVLGLLVFVYFESKRRKESDLVWRIDPSELIFDDPPRILGQGTFGFVLKAEYRGTEVAVKRFVPGGGSDLVPESASKSDAKATGKKSMASPYESIKNQGGAAGTAQTSFAMGQTMSAKASQAMVSQIQGSGSKAQKASSSWKMSKSGRKEIEKQKNEFVEEMKKLATLRHQCVITIMGAVIAKEDSMIVLEFMDHGSLYDVLHNETMVLEGEIILPILRDIAQGLRFLHAAVPQIVHCDLKASNILVDGRFRAKVADFGLSSAETDKVGAAGTPYFLSPEILRGETGNTVESDAFAFGVVLYEVYSRKDPYEGEKPLEVLRLVADAAAKKRPIPPASMPPKAKALMAECLADTASQRPTFEELDLQLKRLDVSIMEPIRQRPSGSEQARSDSMYDEMFPKDIAKALKEGRKVEPQTREDCTIVSSDIVDFSKLANSLPPAKVADMLQRLDDKLDQLCRQQEMYKVETVNESFMAITGLIKDQPDHAKRIAEFSIAAVRAANETPIDVDDPSKGNVSIQVGVSSGPVVANVIGSRNPRYSLFGDAVNTASRMAESSEANRIHCSEFAAMLFEEQCPSIPVKPRGLITVSGKGEMFTFFANETEEGVV